jgi:hypothetical protein
MNESFMGGNTSIRPYDINLTGGFYYCTGRTPGKTPVSFWLSQDIVHSTTFNYGQYCVWQENFCSETEKTNDIPHHKAGTGFIVSTGEWVLPGAE